VPEVLIAGPDLRMASQVALRLKGIPVHPAYAPSTVFESLPSADLLVIDDHFVAETVEFLAELRAAAPHLVVIYCLEPEADAKLVRRLLLDLGVSELLFHPVDPGDADAPRGVFPRPALFAWPGTWRPWRKPAGAQAQRSPAARAREDSGAIGDPGARRGGLA
jgi:hypothetical protein